MFKCIKCGGYCEDFKIAMITGLCVSCWEDSKKEKKPVKDNPIKKVEDLQQKLTELKGEKDE